MGDNRNIITYTEEDRSVQFESHRLSKLKINALSNFGDRGVDVMNVISEYVASNWFDFYDQRYCTFIGVKQFITKIRSLFPNVLPNTFDSETYKIIHTGFSNKAKAINKKLTIKEKQVRDILYYARKTTKYEVNENGERVKVTKNVGDVREIRYKYVETDKTRVLSFLAKYGNENTYEWLKNEVANNPNLSKQKLAAYKKYLKTIDEFGFETLSQEALTHRKNIYDEYITPCIFVSNTLHFDSRIAETFFFNKKKKSCVVAYMKVAVPYESNGRINKHMIIPIKYNKHYHGDLGQYNATKENNHIYMVCCIDKSRRVVDFHISRKQLVAHRAPTDEDVHCAFDVNTEGDKIVGSMDISITHDKDKKLVEEISILNKELKNGQKREKKLSKKQNRDYITTNALSKRKRKKLNKLNHVMSEHNRQDTASAVSKAKAKGANHIIFENLDGKFSKSHAVDKENKQNFNDKTKSMQIASIKNHAIGICQKKGMSISLVQPEYTSQRCPKCGAIHKANRKSQSEFECVECGYKFNADKNADDNMIHRVVSKKLCEKLLKRTDDGYVPNKSITHDMLLDILMQSSCTTLPFTCYSV